MIGTKDKSKTESVWSKPEYDENIYTDYIDSVMRGDSVNQKPSNYVEICHTCSYNPCKCDEINAEKAERLTTATRNAVDALSTESSMHFDAEKNENVYNAECNHGVNRAFCELHGSKELDGMKANEMVSHMRSSPDWEQTALEDVQGLANKGEFIVAGWKNPVPTKSGHVSTIVPGQEDMRVWNDTLRLTPKMAEAGYNKRSWSMPLTGGFGADKHSTTDFYRYKPKY